MKKIICIPLIAAALSCLASCGKQADNQSVLEITGIGISGECGFISEFQAKNPDIKVVLNDYSDDAAPDTGIKRLGASIASENGGDIVIFNRFLDADNFIDKGMLMDLNELDCIKERKDDILPNIIESYEKDGKMYSMTTGFNIYAFACKADTISAEDWNINDFCSTAAPFIKNGDDLFANHSQSCYEQMFYDLAASSGSAEYVQNNFDKLTAMLDSMKEMLNISNSIGNFNFAESCYADDTVLFNDTYIGSFDTYYTLKKLYFNDEINLLGTPAEESTLRIAPEIEFAVMNDAKNKEAAEKFISFYLSDEYQTSNMLSGYYFPVISSVLDKEYEHTLSDKLYDQNDNVVGDKENIEFIGNQKVDIGIPSEDDIREMYDIVRSVKGIEKTDAVIYSIVSEKINDFWSGAISSEDYLSEVIDKLNTYYSEQN